MRHRNLTTKVRGTGTHNRAMFSNMLLGLIEHGRIPTTERRARMLRRVAERIVTRAKRLKDLLLKDRNKLEAADRARVVHAMRMVRRDLKQRDAPRYLGREGGYTRMYKTGTRKGDGAPMAILEFVEGEMPERESAPKPAAPAEKKGRIASLLGGKKASKSEVAPEAKAKAKAGAKPKTKRAKKDEE